MKGCFMSCPLSVIILAAGKGSRLPGPQPKVLRPIGGKPALSHVMETAHALSPDAIYVVHSPDLDYTLDEKVQGIVQITPNGTAAAIQCALPTIPPTHRVLVLYADVPLITPSSLRPLIDAEGLSLLTCCLDNPGHYGRIIRHKDQRILRITEFKDATEQERLIQEVFSGLMAAPADTLSKVLARIENNNAQSEYYLTDCVALWPNHHAITHYCTPHHQDVQGMNTLAEWIQLERYYQRRYALSLIQQGVHIEDPDRFDCQGVLQAGQHCRIGPNVVLRGHIKLGNRVHIDAHCHITESELGDDVMVKPHSVVDRSILGAHTIIGPFAYLRPGTQCEAHNKVGSFVEIKNTYLGAYTKVPHLSYLGDSQLGRQINIGAGVITCNYDGERKHQTVIEDGAFIGSGCQLIAPRHIGKGAYIGAGTTLRHDAKAHALTVIRHRAEIIESWHVRNKAEHV